MSDIGVFGYFCIFFIASFVVYLFARLISLGWHRSKQDFIQKGNEDE